MGYDVDTLTHTVDMHVGSLRQKLEKDPRLPELILNSSRNGLQVCRLKQAHSIPLLSLLVQHLLATAC